MDTWEELDYWPSGEFQVVDERLEDLLKAKVPFNPSKEALFNALDLTSFMDTKVVIIGQDPYPSKKYATGVAFSIPPEIPPKEFPPSLVNIFTEYTNDLRYPSPTCGDLTPWAKQGVLLWNAYPSCEEGKPGSHHWD